ncbi:metallophosphoesterase family protein [Dinghuibacter silviterrae]|uniref:Serine/threonine protein phosphatase 1 n=1 Tax=Dinghuibacter silviterrae TaxID=1539049 RepID=A0A4R8DEZ7_9BACT|nr:metallophosphoesterase family protein [Dinghuibacter silviterrae]TDW96141.1 serine/threonine protein phosphatase 1 [Dinghuibacter silviterrae]
MARTFVIGDIHGAFRALTPLIGRLELRKDDTLVFLGDYVDGWSESAEVIEYLMELAKRYSCIFLKGNHDVWCEEWLDGLLPDVNWLMHGGLATVESYAQLTKTRRKQHLSFFRRMSLYHVDENNRLFVHAGFTSQQGPEGEHFLATLTWDRTLWELALATDPALTADSNRYPKRLTRFSEVFIGHTPTTNFDQTLPMHACNVWNLDTGAAFTGRLTAMNVDTYQFWQSEVVQGLYPEEKGRNP